MRLILHTESDIDTVSLSFDSDTPQAEFDLGYLDAPLRNCVKQLMPKYEDVDGVEITRLNAEIKALNPESPDPHIGEQILSISRRVHEITSKYDIFSASFEGVRYALRSWRYVRGADGKDLVLRHQEQVIPKVGLRTVVHPDIMRNLPHAWIIELGGKIATMNFVSESDSKN